MGFWAWAASVGSLLTALWALKSAVVGAVQVEHQLDPVR